MDQNAANPVQMSVYKNSNSNMKLFLIIGIIVLVIIVSAIAFYLTSLSRNQSPSLNTNPNSKFTPDGAILDTKPTGSASDSSAKVGSPASTPTPSVAPMKLPPAPGIP